MSAETINKIVDFVITFFSELLLPFLIFTFFVGLFLRGVIYYSMSRELWFVKEFSKRVDRLVTKMNRTDDLSFYIATKKLFERTFYEVFELRGIMMRRKPDYIASLTDRLFVIHQGCARIVKDTLKQIHHLKHNGEHPKMLAISRNVLENNSCFNRLFGVIPSAPLNDVLSLLPGLFVVGGIFGTFLGIMKALPELGHMNIDDPASTKMIMDNFLAHVAFSMSTSVCGIFLSVCTQIFQSIFSPEKVFIASVECLENSFDILWNRSTSNLVPDDVKNFDENRDPVEALAEQAVERQIGEEAPGRHNGGHSEAPQPNREVA